MAGKGSELTRREFLGRGVGIAAAVGLLGPLGGLALAGEHPRRPLRRSWTPSCRAGSRRSATISHPPTSGERGSRVTRAEGSR